ncbi:glycoside hydrolase family 13 protein [Aureobasidium subglaciale EXF-2481]|uniref:Glycoside hydrolase family 13 protein n=1 Tax=Aureobasidium subglaciale (strain EXF-2481) TaxID=1043005 RepID=A0A074YCP9_AURSE|nr:glycoside hydrolase family 13 protein [Aureobasidium subglaciale EXF-2481]KEQ91912.1 glycoside hydrolase family 13 protein [Aureobasidium subglaciale EXF-2481]
MCEKSNINKQRWWKEAIVYQIYPASFLDSGAGDRPGWGDIRGITSKVDYLKELGVDVLWLSPIYKSPQADMGYDIVANSSQADYKDIDPVYGSLEDVDNLISELKKRDMKLMMDLVVNHTSDQHAWFLDSRSSKQSSKRDWYIWKPAKYDKDGNRQPPNNWSMILGEENSAWTYDEKTDEYYLSLFTAEQPDLNWENPDVREAVHDVLRFWLDRGCSGFRMDVINHISKVQTFPDADVIAPDHKYQPGYKFYCNGPRLHEWLKNMRAEVLDKYDTITVGEMPFVRDESEILKIVREDEKELNMIFIFEQVDIDNEPGKYRMTWRDWDADEIRKIFSYWQRLMIDKDGWNSLFVENHDNPRSVSRYCNDSDEFRELSAKLLCLMMTTLGGTLYVYQGQELGMRNVPVEWSPEEYKDVESINYWKKMNHMHPDNKEKLDFARKVLQRKARDHSRTPVQWSAEPNAGFCKEDVTPWMRVNDDYKEINAEAQRKQDDPDKLSVLQFWKRGLANRKEHKDVFVYGDFQVLDEEDKRVFAYKRASESEAFVLALNFTKDEVKWEVPEAAKVKSWVAGNYTAGKPDKPTSGTITLRPFEGVLGSAEM